jgi:hypothetical protein
MNPSDLLIDVAAFPGGVAGLLVVAGLLAAIAIAGLIAFKIFARTLKMAVKMFVIVGVLVAILIGASAAYFLSGSDKSDTKPTKSGKAR